MALVTSFFGDGATWTGAGNNATIGPFTLLGGRYAVIVGSTGTSSVQLNVLGADGATYVSCGAPVTSTGVFDLPPGTYEIVTGAADSTGFGVVQKVPYNPAY